MTWNILLTEALAEHSKVQLPGDVSLPVMPSVVTEFSQKADNPNANAKQLSAIVENDGGLTMELLKHVNSSALGLKRKAVTTQQAISLLGIRQSKLFLLTRGLRLSLAGLKDSRVKELIDLEQFSHSNLERALFAQRVAKMFKADADIAFAASMMQDVMLPVLIESHFDIYQRHLESISSVKRPLIEIERECFDNDHAVAAAFQMKDWGFPDDLVYCCLRHHADLEILADAQLGRSAVAAVAMASLLPDQLQQTPNGLLELQRLEEKLAGFSLNSVAAIVDEYIAEQNLPGMQKRVPLVQRIAESSAVAVEA
ncbi:MAG: HDOD domain-containing protein [Planctomycetes bacterium]|nr:HDOD domain-containing protein [Planctomycetota bacterium]